ncbi:EamA family transporter RarD [Kribbella sp. NBC_01245]|uniref:EamA family transporter RarD n=1 Tax=Kribbella sp. NBC_01245 TaxID=2903578 RepID=UPI002E28D81D|nr:EamA family transporter RarD [Kribbella sp. NBC_01245]
MPDQRSGFLFGFGAYFLWGVFPLYWRLLDHSGAVEVLAHRIVWSLLSILLLVFALRRTAQLRAILGDRRRLSALVIASALISVNWGTYIWGVHNGYVVEMSLGYFITPLFSVLLGVLLLKERLRTTQWVAIGIAFAAVVVLTIENGRPPYVALVLAFSFGFYGFTKKKANAGAVEGMAIESAAAVPLALAMIVALGIRGDSTVTSNGTAYFLLAVLAGPVTAIPLLMFGAAATRISMTALGLLNYVAPIMQLAIGVLVFREPMSNLRWAGFALVWVALVVLTVDGLTQRRRVAVLAATV